MHTLSILSLKQVAVVLDTADSTVSYIYMYPIFLSDCICLHTKVDSVCVCVCVCVLIHLQLLPQDGQHIHTGIACCTCHAQHRHIEHAITSMLMYFHDLYLCHIHAFTVHSCMGYVHYVNSSIWNVTFHWGFPLAGLSYKQCPCNYCWGSVHGIQATTQDLEVMPGLPQGNRKDKNNNYRQGIVSHSQPVIRCFCLRFTLTGVFARHG